MRKTTRFLSFFVCVITVFGCFGSCGKTSDTVQSFFAMDTYVTLRAYGSDENTVSAVAEAEKIIKEIEARYSVSSAMGEIARLSEQGELTEYSEGFSEMLECARVLYERTDGAYDITLRAFSELWGFSGDCVKRVPEQREIDSAFAKVGFDKLVFEDGKLLLGDVYGIDLGSIAKGYAGREAKKLLEEKEVFGGILDLGGNIVAFGKKPNGSDFKIAVTDPADANGTLGYLKIAEGSVVTSGTYQRYFEEKGVKYHHIIDGKTGKPCQNGIVSVTVLHEDSMWADALSTALFLLGYEGAAEYYRQYGGFEAVIVTADGRVAVTEGLQDKFTLTSKYTKVMIEKELISSNE